MDAQNSPDRPFDLKGDSADFQSKKSDVFASLGDIEKSYQSNLAVRLGDDDKEEVESDSSGSRDVVVSNFDDSGFKRPRSPGRSQRSAYSRGREFRSKAWSRRDDFKWKNKSPDFENNPDKWKKYSLEDTSVCGNPQNTRVAFDLIRQLKRRRGDEEEGTAEGDSATADLGQKMVFSKPESRIDDDSTTEKQQSYNDVHKMHEYDFGVKIPRHKVLQKPEQGETDTNVALSLQHIDDEEGLIQDHTGKSDALEKEVEGDSSDLTEAVTSKRGLVEGNDQAVSKDVSTVGFKKRKGKRNIRHRPEEQDD